MTKVANKYYAAIDLGTNSCRLVIADENGNYVCKDTVATKLGEGMHAQNKLTNEAQERTLECFFNFKKKIDKYNISANNIRAIATASCRLASNGEDFLHKVYHETLIKPSIISGTEEARLNLIGAMDNVHSRAQYVLMYDLGGGSTEITIARKTKNPEIIHTISIPWGARNSSEAFQLSEYSIEKASLLRKEIKRWVDGFKQECNWENYKNNVCVVATSSTPLRLVSMVKEFGEYDRERADGITVKYPSVDKQIESIYNMTTEEMAENRYIGEKRSMIFVAAGIIFQTISQGLEVKEFTASLKSAKDGIIKELINNDKTNKISPINQRAPRNNR